MSKIGLDDTEKYPHVLNQEEYNDDDFNENLDTESEKNKIVEYSPKGRFIRFNEELGSGAYKTVYKAYDNETGWEVAWNVIKLQRLPDKERKRISDEIALLKQLKHPNIIHFISAWINRQKEEVVFITEAVTGGSLKRYMKKIKAPRLKVIKTWCREILQGIDYLHSLQPHPIIHRDIKCDNIFINSNKGEIRIGDLGLATFMSNAYADSLLGTPEFMAPEMYEEVYGPSVDIYSFGMCVLEMVTNQTPYRECMNPAQIYRKVSKGIKPSALNLIANDEVKNFIIECLKPKDERPTAAELLKHKFLGNVDSEIDNQPVALYDSPPLTKADEERKGFGSMRVNEQIQKVYLRAAEDSGSEKDHDKSPGSSGEKEKEKEKEENKQNFVAVQTPLASGVEAHHVEANSKKLEKEPPAKEKSPEPIPPLQSQLPQQTKEEIKRSSHKIEVEDIKLSPDRSNVTIKQEDSVSHDQSRNGHEHEQKSVQEEIKQPDCNVKAQEADPMKQEQPAHKVQEKQNKTLQKEEEQKSLDSKKQSDEVPNIHMSHKEVNRYAFYSKGLINNYLVLGIKTEGQDNAYEHIIEIPKEKIDSEKIKKKLLKRLELTNPNDSYFVYQLNVLYESLISQNILSYHSYATLVSGGTSNLHYAKSVTNESQRSQKSPGGSVLNTNPNSVNFQLKYFHKFYQKYLSQISKDYILQESEEAMNLRHQRELLELENLHLVQKRNLWDRRQFLMSNTCSSNIPMASNTFQFTFEADDFSQKFFLMNEVSSRSGVKKRGSHGTDVTISSVDSATLSPTYSSGNNIHSMSNWGEPHSNNHKKEEYSVNGTEEAIKINHGIESVNESEKAIISQLNLDTTPLGHPSFQQGSLSNISNSVSPKANTFPSKATNNNFVIQANKTASVKSQSDKSGFKEKKLNEPQQKDIDSLPSLVKKPSVDKNVGDTQNLAECLLQNQAQQGSTQHPAQPLTQIITNSQSIQHQHPHPETNKDANNNFEETKESRYEKLTVNTNLASPPEKANQKTVQDNTVQQKVQQKAQPPTQPLSISSNYKKAPLLPPGATNLTPANNLPAESSQGLGYSNCTGINPQGLQPGQALTAQPTSATLRSSSGLHNQISNTPLVNTNTKTGYNQAATTNPVAPKIAILSHQNSLGPPQSLPLPTNQTNRTIQPARNVKTPTANQANIENPSKNIMKSNDISHPTHIKLQSAEILDKIKSHKFTQTLKRQELGLDVEDVKMLQICLELLTESDILPNGHFSHYTENLLKTWQESSGVTADGVVDQTMWDKMIDALDKKIEKKRGTKGIGNHKEGNEMEKGREEIKKKIKDKQNKEASECLNKIESNLVDLSDLK